MSSESIPEATEVIVLPKPSWAPAFFGFGAAFLVCGIFANGFIFPAFIYSLFGLLLVLLALRSIVRGSERSFFRLPRRQTVRSAALPAATLSTRKSS